MPSAPKRSYMRVRWLHDMDGYPIDLYCEMDVDRNEVRKVDVFRDGRMQAAAEGFTMGDTELGWEPVPLLEEIDSRPEFDAFESTADEFELVWAKAIRRRENS